MAFDQEVGIDFFPGPAGGDGEGGGTVLALGDVVEELHCHMIGVEEYNGDVVVACAWNGLGIPQELEGVARKGTDGGGQWLYGSATEDESREVVLEAVGGVFDQRIVVVAGGGVHFGYIGSETIETQRDDRANEAHDLHYEGEAGTVVELPLGAAVVVVGGHGTHAKLSVTDVANDGADVSGEGA